jgi:hypothetical protein
MSRVYLAPFARLALAALVAVIALCAPTGIGRADAVSPTFKVDPSSVSVDEGAQFQVRVTISDVEKLGSFEFNLDFDERVIEYVSVSKGLFIESTGRSAACVPLVSDDKDTLRYGCVTLQETPIPPSGSGILAEVTFRARRAGSSQLRLSFSQIVVGNGINDPAEGHIPGCTGPGGYCDTTNGSVTVAGEDPLPTATPSEPTQPNDPQDADEPEPQPSMNPNAPGATSEGAETGVTGASNAPSGQTPPGGRVASGERAGSASDQSPQGFAVAGYGPEQGSLPWWKDATLAIALGLSGVAAFAVGTGTAMVRRTRGS